MLGGRPQAFPAAFRTHGLPKACLRAQLALLGGHTCRKARSEMNALLLSVCLEQHRVWEGAHLHCASWQLRGNSRQRGGGARGELLVSSAGGSRNLWPVRNSERTWGSSGLWLASLVSTFMFFWSSYICTIHTSSFKSFNPFPQEKADRRVSLRNMTLLVATLYVSIFACEAAFPAPPCLLDSSLVLYDAAGNISFPISSLPLKLTDLWLLPMLLLTLTVPVPHRIAKVELSPPAVAHLTLSVALERFLWHVFICTWYRNVLLRGT